MEETYTHGHQEPVLRSHRWRTAANSAAYLLPHLNRGMDLLDVGCGPGTITTELAAVVAPGRAVGLDREPEVIEEAGRSSGGRAEFLAGDVYGLEFEGGSFDVVHAHQVLQHLADPVAALTEMRRVLRPGGLLAVRDADYGSFLWHPADARLDRWREIYTAVCARNGADADAGRRLPSWVAAAGFNDLEVSSSNWTFADAESRAWWTGLWADRTVGSSFAEQALNYGLSTRGELEEVASGWREWGTNPDGLFVVVHVEVLARA
ncbi:MAG TPA: methyltransferase domain-containing protein [Acidimicrobiales bacterium]|nr:methyltransferase domain-containing protein [Acidimicrobiales bacterium]